MTKSADLFSARQLIALSIFCDLVGEARSRIQQDAQVIGLSPEQAKIHADAVATYLGLAVSKSADYWSNICIWRSDPKNLGTGHVFALQTIQMVWDFAEANIFSGSSGNWLNNLEWTAKVVEFVDNDKAGHVTQQDAVTFL